MNNTFSSRIKELRTSLNMTQSDFAASIGSSQNALSAYENGDRIPSYEILTAIASVHNVSIDWLCGLSDKKTLSNEFEDYPALLRTLLSICTITYEDSTVPVVNISTTHESSIHFIIENDHLIQSFFKEWKKIYALYSSGTIDNELYNLWIEKELSKHKKHKIDGLPF